MGIAVALFINGYWLASLFPASSRQLLLLTLLVGLLAAAVYWLILASTARRLLALPRGVCAAAILGSLAIALFLFFCGTAQWRLPSQYVTFLLPTHDLEIRASSEAPGGLALAWVNTSVGDVSYGAMSVTGWRRAGDELILENPAQNSIEWRGKTGADVQLVFRASAADHAVTISWDSQDELLSLASGRSTYTRRFAIPWYASGWFVDVLGIITLATVALVVLPLVWERRASVAETLRSSVMGGGIWDRWETLFLLAAAAAALLLRVTDLGRANPAVDEYYHLIAARQLVEGASLGSVYSRALWMVTLPVSLAFRVFGYQLWAARLVGALVNVLAIWPLYLLARRINRPVAMLAVLLYATSPWITTFARLAREYAYYPVFAYAIILGMVSLVERIPQEFVVLRDWRNVVRRGTVLIGAALLLPPIFAFVIDPLSTFRVMMIAYVVFAAFLLARFNWRDRRNLPVVTLIAAVVLAAGYAAYLRDTARIVAEPWVNPVPGQYFFPDPPQQWYYGRLVILAAIAILAAVSSSVLVRRVNIIPLFVLCLFAVYLAFFTFLSKTFFHTRHLTTTELWYSVLLAFGLYFGWRVLQVIRPWGSRGAGIAIGAVLVLSLANPGQILLPVTSTSPDNPISEDYLHDLSAVQAYLVGRVQPSDVLISTVYTLYNSWVEKPHFAATYRITTETPREEILSLMDQHASGWIVIDQIRLNMSTLGPRAFAGNPDVEYIGLFGDQNVWHWQHSPGAVGTTMVAGKAP